MLSKLVVDQTNKPTYLRLTYALTASVYIWKRVTKHSNKLPISRAISWVNSKRMHQQAAKCGMGVIDYCSSTFSLSPWLSRLLSQTAFGMTFQYLPKIESLLAGYSAHNILECSFRRRYILKQIFKSQKCNCKCNIISKNFCLPPTIKTIKS